MSVNTLRSFLAMPFLQKISASWELLNLVNMEILAFSVPLLALALKPMHTNRLLMLRLVTPEVMALIDGNELIVGQQIVVVLRLHQLGEFNIITITIVKSTHNLLKLKAKK